MKTTSSAAQAHSTPTPKPVARESDTQHQALVVLAAARTALEVRGWHPSGALGKEPGPVSLGGALAIAADVDPGDPLPDESGLELAYDSLWFCARALSLDLAAWQDRPGCTQRDALRLIDEAIDRLECGKPPPPPCTLIKEVLNGAALLIEQHGLCKGRPKRMNPDGVNKERSVLTALFDASVSIARAGAGRAPTNSLAPEIYAHACEALDRALPWAWRRQIERWGDQSNQHGVVRVLRGASGNCGHTHVWSNQRESIWVSYPGEQESVILRVRQLRETWQWSIARAADGEVQASGKEASLNAARAAAQNSHLNAIAPRRSF